MEVKKVFALASVTVLTGLVSAASAVGCSSTTTIEDPGDAATDARKEGGSSSGTSGGEEATVPEEGTVGKLCKTDADCEVPNSVGDNVCSIGFFTIGDIYGDPVCVSTCTRGPGMTFADIGCDGDDQGFPGVCNAQNPGAQGVCLPACEFDATAIKSKCEGSNGCAPQFFGTSDQGAVFSLGICLGNCTADADCKGSPGSKCQSEIGLCVNKDKYVAYTNTVVGTKCNGAATPDECNCNTFGGTNAANKDLGYCGASCTTGAAGNTFCNGKAAGWKCTAGLPVKFTDGKPAFTAQPDGILGGCALPCTADGDCTPLATAVGGGTAYKCEDTAGFKVCVANSK